MKKGLRVQLIFLLPRTGWRFVGLSRAMNTTAPASPNSREEISELQSDVRNLKALLNRINKSAAKFSPTDETTLASAIELTQHIETKLDTCVAALGTVSNYDLADQRGSTERRDNSADQNTPGDLRAPRAPTPAPAHKARSHHK